MPLITIDVTIAQANRIAAAFGKVRNLTTAQGVSRPATLAEVRAELIGYMANLAQDIEKRAAQEAVVAIPLDII